MGPVLDRMDKYLLCRLATVITEITVITVITEITVLESVALASLNDGDYQALGNETPARRPSRTNTLQQQGGERLALEAAALPKDTTAVLARRVLLQGSEFSRRWLALGVLFGALLRHCYQGNESTNCYFD